MNDSKEFEKFAPKRGDILQVMHMCDGESVGPMMVEVVYADKMDDKGVLAILKFLDASDSRLAEWGKKYITGSTLGDVSSFHFCRAAKCRAGDDNTLHIHKWKFVDDELDGEPLDDVESVPSDDNAGGVRVFDAGRTKAASAGSSTMKKVAELRERLSGLKVGTGAAKPPVSGGMQPSKMTQSLRKIVGQAGDNASPSMKASSTKLTVASLLADRTAQRAEKAAVARNALVAKKKTVVKGRAAGSGDPLDDEISDDRSGDDKDDGDSESVFRKSPSLFRVSRILGVASRSEGTLMQNGVQLMARALSLHQRGGSGVPVTESQTEDMQDVVTTYLTTAMIPGAAAAGQHMGIRTIREMRTLAEGLDAIIRGEPAKAGDILMQRFRAAEMAVSDGHWTLAQHLELIPETTVSSIPLGMRAELIREQNRRDKYQDRGGGRGRR